MPQFKYQFDRITLCKIGKGALISATGAGALYILNAIGALQFDNPAITSLIAFAVPFMVNLVREFMRGETN